MSSGAQAVAVSHLSWAKQAPPAAEPWGHLVPCGWQWGPEKHCGHSQYSRQQSRKSWGWHSWKTWPTDTPSPAPPSASPAHLQLSEARLCVGSELSLRKHVQAGGKPFRGRGRDPLFHPGHQVLLPDGGHWAFLPLGQQFLILFETPIRVPKRNACINKWDCTGYMELVHFSSITQSCPTLCNPMDGSRPGLPVYHQLPEFTQTHVHWVSDAIQQSHPLSSPSPVFNLSQHQGLFKWVSSSHQVAKVLEFQLQHQSFQWTFRTDFL